jgi:hypothetical protein
MPAFAIAFVRRGAAPCVPPLCLSPYDPAHPLGRGPWLVRHAPCRRRRAPPAPSSWQGAARRPPKRR